jgi:hypothetical protein
VAPFGQTHTTRSTVVSSTSTRHLLAGAARLWARGGVMARNRRVDTRRSAVVSPAYTRHNSPDPLLGEAGLYISPSLSLFFFLDAPTPKHEISSPNILPPRIASRWSSDFPAKARRRTGWAAAPFTTGSRTSATRRTTRRRPISAGTILVAQRRQILHPSTAGEALPRSKKRSSSPSP